MTLSEPELTAGDIDDVFASDSEDDEAQQQHRDVGHISEAEEEEDEFEAMFSGSKKKKRAQGRTREVSSDFCLSLSMLSSLTMQTDDFVQAC